jgi:hypothetical protein
MIFLERIWKAMENSISVAGPRSEPQTFRLWNSMLRSRLEYSEQTCQNCFLCTQPEGLQSVHYYDLVGAFIESRWNAVAQHRVTTLCLQLVWNIWGRVILRICKLTEENSMYCWALTEEVAVVADVASLPISYNLTFSIVACRPAGMQQPLLGNGFANRHE